MVRFMVVTFAFLGWAFYMLSGGADFDPDRARLDNRTSDPLKSADTSRPASEPPAEAIEVTRISLDLTSVEDVLADEGDTRTPTAPPRQPLPQVQTLLDTEDVEIIPSLVENASPQAVISDANGTGMAYETGSVSLDTGADFRVVTGTRVNVRGGPGTSHAVLDTLVQGDEVEVLDDSGTGWVRIRATGGGTAGWMAASLLTRG